MAEKAQIQYINLNDIIPYANNPRNNDGEAVDKVASSIKEFGFNVPLVIDKDNVIITGHTRYKAAKKLKIDEVPCIYAEHLTPAQVKAYRIADNKVSEFSTWNNDLLSIEIEQLQELDFDLELTGLEITEITDLISGDDEEEEPEVSEANFNYQEQYGVIVMCEDEEQQEKIYNDLLEQGYTCKVVAT